MNDTWKVILFFAAEFFLFSFLFGIWLFLLLHAVRHIENPKKRVAWAAYFVVFHVFALFFYYYMHYRKFRAHGKGGLCLQEK